MIAPASATLAAAPSKMAVIVCGGRFSGKAGHVQRQQNSPAHGVDITHAVGSRDGAVGPGVDDDGGEEIDRLHDGQIGRKPIDRGIIAGLQTNDEILVRRQTSVDAAPAPGPLGPFWLLSRRSSPASSAESHLSSAREVFHLNSESATYIPDAPCNDDRNGP